MAKTRKEIPKGTREKVLKEYKHHCAICGGDDPELHHIDEDPSNNDPLNLIPLCPNNHTRQHNPVSAIEPDRLRLFRIYKHPYIIKPQFHPLFTRLQFLDDIDEDTNVLELSDKTKELIELVKAHEMGDFYGKRLGELFTRPYNSQGWAPPGNQEVERHLEQIHRKEEQEYRQKLTSSREKVYELVVEMLWYQRWETTPPDVSVHR